jgi:DNA-binding Lrp family transcriptional regulator
LEKEGVLREFTVIPDFRKLGYNIVALTFGNINRDLQKKDEVDDARKDFVRCFDDSSDEIIADVRGIGLGHDGSIVSFHRNYSEYVEFKKRCLKRLSLIPLRLSLF